MTKATKPQEEKIIIEDCISRKGYRCTKLDKPVAIDKRNPNQPTCWEKPYCEHFDDGTIKPEEEEPEEPPEKPKPSGQQKIFQQ